jgi:hypothetical protein
MSKILSFSAFTPFPQPSTGFPVKKSEIAISQDKSPESRAE